VANTSYKDLKGADGLSLAEIRHKVLTIRAHKFPDLKVEGTAGSFFLNPIVTKEVAEGLRTHYPDMPQFPTEEGVKLSMAWLLDKVLGVVGMVHGGARLYEKQPLVVVAKAGASARDVRELAEKIKNLVQEKLKIKIEEEVRIL
jgi:UDP-N-acetylmuramate dehydrogenase